LARVLQVPGQGTADQALADDQRIEAGRGHGSILAWA
jgi:hypothetical protein